MAYMAMHRGGDCSGLPLATLLPSLLTLLCIRRHFGSSKAEAVFIFTAHIAHSPLTGIQPDKELMAPGDRPLSIQENGRLLRDILA